MSKQQLAGSRWISFTILPMPYTHGMYKMYLNCALIYGVNKNCFVCRFNIVSSIRQTFLLLERAERIFDTKVTPHYVVYTLILNYVSICFIVT